MPSRWLAACCRVDVVNGGDGARSTSCQGSTTMLMTNTGAVPLGSAAIWTRSAVTSTAAEPSRAEHVNRKMHLAGERCHPQLRCTNAVSSSLRLCLRGKALPADLLAVQPCDRHLRALE